MESVLNFGFRFSLATPFTAWLGWENDPTPFTAFYEYVNTRLF